MPKSMKATGMKKCIGCFTCMLMCAGFNEHNHSISKSAIRVATKGGLSSGFQATVCLACTGIRACAEVCPSGALEDRPGGGVLLKKELCIGCRKCQTACIAGAVNFDEEKGLPIICRHCGVCTRFCPHGCLVMKGAEEE